MRQKHIAVTKRNEQNVTNETKAVKFNIRLLLFYGSPQRGCNSEGFHRGITVHRWLLGPVSNRMNSIEQLRINTVRLIDRMKSNLYPIVKLAATLALTNATSTMVSDLNTKLYSKTTGMCR